ncbi:hypothetical protein EVAR_85518_1 [Eumeta japonica]|uniref:Uncharacterized protein n=1 Tax=Eumeta variegata TaxID=151549 RepID=A0A4C1VCL2_EUMVA|nr:hypothetical protein EVAR_85518_1 [Eumeta japonica]
MANTLSDTYPTFALISRLPNIPYKDMCEYLIGRFLKCFTSDSARGFKVMVSHKDTNSRASRNTRRRTEPSAVGRRARAPAAGSADAKAAAKKSCFCCAHNPDSIIVAGTGQ